MAIDPQEILERLQRVLGEAPAPLHEPRFAGHEWKYVKDCIDSGWVSSAGSYVREFEQQLAALCGVPHAIAVVNGTAALHLAFVVAGVKPGDEVIIPALTFVATANAVAHAGATPHLADSDDASLGLDPVKLRLHLRAILRHDNGQAINRLTGRRIAAIVPMHTFGHPCDMDALARIAAEFGIPLIEDAAESLGSTYRDRPCGSFGLISALSFNGNKIVTAGGGGALLTSNAELAQRARHLSTTAKLKHSWAFDHDEVAWNYRLPNLNAALGCAQLEQLADFLTAKRALARQWQNAFDGMRGLKVFVPPAFAQSNHWLTALILDREEAHRRDAILELTNASGATTRPVWKLMQDLPAFRDSPRMNLECAIDLERRIINIPSSARHGMHHEP